MWRRDGCSSGSLLSTHPSIILIHVLYIHSLGSAFLHVFVALLLLKGPTFRNLSESSAMVCRKRPAKAPSTGKTQRHPSCACGKRRQHKLEEQFYCSGCFLKDHPEAARAANQKRYLGRKQDPARAASVRAKCACGKREQHRFEAQSYCSGCFLKTHPEAAQAASQKRHLGRKEDPTRPARVRAKCA